jgi:malate/lactate dehydrogenase
MHAALQDQVVEWDLEVYEVRARDANYEIVSEPTSARYSDATALLRVVATVIPRNDAERALIEALQTGSRIRLRGLLTGISLRVVVGMSPAVVVIDERKEV